MLADVGPFCLPITSRTESGAAATAISGSRSTIADLNKGPQHQIATDKIKALGMTFGGAPLLQQTVAQLVQAQRSASR